MPKLKTHKGTAKRIKLTSTGKLTRQRALAATCWLKSQKVVNAQSTQQQQ